ncbi:unnamed protein product [Absidia cylindrospora]
MNTIPTEIAFAIARNADEKDFHALTLLNRQFYTVANPLLWRSVVIENKTQFLKFLSGTVLSKGYLFEHIRCLIIHMPITDDILLMLIPLLSPVFEKLGLAEAKHITDESLKHLPSQCPQLTSLRIAHGAFTDVTMVSLGQHCHQLRQLSLYDCKPLPSNLLTALAACPLEDIDINGCLIGSTEDDQDERQFARDLANVSHLTSLCLFDMYVVVNHLLLVPSIWPHLTHCYLQGCRDLEDSDAIRFIKAHPQLTELEFSANNFSDDVLYTIADALPQLTYLDLSGGWDFTHHGARRIILNCPLLASFDLDCTHLKRLDFPELGPFSDDDLAMFSGNQRMLTNLGDLGRDDSKSFARIESQQQQQQQQCECE